MTLFAQTNYCLGFPALLWLSATLLGGCAHEASTRSKGFETARSTLEALETSSEPQRWAIVIGVDKYDDITFGGLEYATRDAEAVSRVLADKKLGGFDRVIRLTSTAQTTRESILNELSRLRYTLRRQDTFLLYFSGHGTLEFNENGDPFLYLVASNTRAEDFWSTAIELGALRSFLHELKPLRKVMILDNCFAGTGKSRVSATTRARLSEQPPPWPTLEASMGQSEAVLMASTLGGIAQEDDRLQQGVYTHYLLAGLTGARHDADTNGDGAITAYEAHDFARVGTMSHTKGAQVPEGFFRVLGRADIFLSGSPNQAREDEVALVYGYQGADAKLELSIDGRAKGTLPRTIAVEPGKRRVLIRDPSGRVVADGALHFSAGQVYPVGLLIEELEGYRRYFSMETGYNLQVSGPARDVWGDRAARLGVVSGYRVRGGTLRGLTVSMRLGWNPARTGVWVDLTEEDWRHMFDVGGQIVLRRPVGRFELGAGWQGTAVYAPQMVPQEVVDPEQRQYLHSWLTLENGPVFWQGYALDRHLLLTLEQRAAIYSGDYQDSLGRGLNVRFSLIAGLEIGF